jgi:hypothetical protein
LKLEEATTELARELERMEPFGQGNRPASFLSRAVDADAFADAESAGVRFTTPVSQFREPTDMVVRLRDSEGVPLVTVVDTIARSRAGG